MDKTLAEGDIQKLLTCTIPFMRHVHLVQESFNLLPDKLHYGACINYVDLQEYREEFCAELINTILDWVYSQEKAKTIMQALMQEGRGQMNAQIALFQRAQSKFRTRDSRQLHLQGQFGELLLFNFLQSLYGAVPLLRKMPITTSAAMERSGADAIHYMLKGEKNIFFLGESKAYTADYQFGTAFQDALDSILNSYKSHRQEMDLYIYDDFIDERLISVARDYKNAQLKNVEIHLVAIIIYNEKSAIAKQSEAQIKESIMQTIRTKGKKIDRNIFDGIDPGLLPRLNYIILPIWELEQLIITFQHKIGL